MAEMLQMAKKFELSENLNKKLILVKNIYLAIFLVKLEKKVIFGDFGDMCYCALFGSAVVFFFSGGV